MFDLGGKDLAENLFKLIYYLIPGFIASGTLFFLIPTRKQSDWNRAITSLGLSIFIYFGLKETSDILHWLGRNVQYMESAGKYFLASGCTAVLLGFILSKICKSQALLWFLNKCLKINYSVELDVWSRVFEIPKGDQNVRVTLSDGREFFGYPRSYTTDPEDEVKELFLDHAYERVGDTYEKISGKGVFIQADKITSVIFLSGQSKEQQTQ